MNATPTLRQRWQKYHRLMRIAAACRQGRCQLIYIDAAAAERAARDWAAPFLHRLS